MPSFTGHKCIRCGKPLPSVSESKRDAKGLLCYEHFLQTAEGRQLLVKPYEPPKPVDTGAGGPGRYIDQIHIHHSASESGNAASFEYYHSVVLGWGEIAYNLVVCNGSGGADGEVQLGKTDDHYPFSVGVDSLNRRALAIVYVGNFSPGRYPTPLQWKNGVGACKHWTELYPDIVSGQVGGHRWFNNNSACPGFEDSAIARMVADIFDPDYGKQNKIQEDDMAQLVPIDQNMTKWQGHMDFAARPEACLMIQVASGESPGVPNVEGDLTDVTIYTSPGGRGFKPEPKVKLGVGGATYIWRKAGYVGPVVVDSGGTTLVVQVG